MKYFKFEEFDSPDKPGSGKKMNRATVDKFDRARAIAGIPFIITSGVRTKKHNKEVGGKEDSSHLESQGCHACDISVPDSRSRFIILRALIKVGFTRIGIGKDLIHADDDPTKDPEVTWLYPFKK